jgi:glycosyltransferase involved in cell wall biosynthesis
MLRERKSKQRVRISLVLPSIGLGGAEIVNIALAVELLRRNILVDIVTASDQPSSHLLVPEGVRLVVLSARRLRNVMLPFIDYLRREQPDVSLVSMWPLTAVCVAAHRFARSQSRLILSEHNTLSVQYRNRGLAHRLTLQNSIALTYPFAHERVAVSAGVADDLAKLSGIARDRFSVIYNPVLMSRCAGPDQAAAEEAWGGWRGPRILTVGRFKAQKNHPLLIRAFKKLLAIRDARLLMLGAGDLFEATENFAREMGVAGKVIMPGAVSDPTPYYRSADLFVLSSDYEGFGNVIVEALACGLPVVSTDCKSGPAEILDDGRYGRLVPVGDAEALACAIDEALAAKHCCEELIQRAADFAPRRIADQYLKLFFTRPPDTRAIVTSCSEA